MAVVTHGVSGPRMSLTNMRRVPGSSTSSIIRAASPPTSGIDANSRNLTRITPSVVESAQETDQLPSARPRRPLSAASGEWFA